MISSGLDATGVESSPRLAGRAWGRGMDKISVRFLSSHSLATVSSANYHGILTRTDLILGRLIIEGVRFIDGIEVIETADCRSDAFGALCLAEGVCLPPSSNGSFFRRPTCGARSRQAYRVCPLAADTTIFRTTAPII